MYRLEEMEKIFLRYVYHHVFIVVLHILKIIK